MLAGNGQRWREETGQGTFALFSFFFFFFCQLHIALNDRFRKCSHLGLRTVCPSNNPRKEDSALSCDSRTLGSFTSFLTHSASGSAPRWWGFPGELAAALFGKLKKIVPSGETSLGLLQGSRIVFRLQVTRIGSLLFCRKRPFSKL